MARLPSDLQMMRVALSDARERIAETGGTDRDRWIVSYYERLTLTDDERRAIGLEPATHCLTLYFLGAGRPLYIEAGDFDHACLKLFTAIGGLAPETRANVEQWARDIDARRAGMPSYSAISCEHGALGLSWKRGRQDVEFARRMGSMPAYPGLSYVDCVSNRAAIGAAA